MKVKNLIIVLIMVVGVNLLANNLVQNPGFEDSSISSGKDISEEIKPKAIKAEQGFCYKATLTLGRTADQDGKSECILLEDGKPLSTPHSKHQDIRDTGKGKYSHWTVTSLYFSASDNSDPRTNGRKYTLSKRTASDYLNKWIVRDANGGANTYHYHLTKEGGGHGPAGVHSGKNAIEIYSSGRITNLAQGIEIVQPGRYRVSFYARPNGATFVSQLNIKLSNQDRNVVIVSQAWRQYFVDFDLSKPEKTELIFRSQNLGIAIDDIKLDLVPTNGETGQIFCDLYPSSPSRAKDIQYYFPGVKQWINYALSSPQMPKMDIAPTLNFIIPKEVKVEGFNLPVLERFRPDQVKKMELTTSETKLNGVEAVCYSLPMPKLYKGITESVYPGFWVSSEKAVVFPIQIVIKSGDKIIFEATWQLQPVEIPKEYASPKRIKSICYHVTDWKDDFEASSASIPRLFSIAGFNVWSDYGLYSAKLDGQLTNQEKIVQRACNEYGVKNIWPNFATMDKVNSWHYESAGEKDKVGGKYKIDVKGVEHPDEYSALYMANGGRDWVDSCIAGWVKTVKRGEKNGIPCNGIINDGLEVLFVSFDSTTLDDFAMKYNIPRKDLTPKLITEKYNLQWTKYNLMLYGKICAIWSAAIKAVDPSIYVVNTHKDFGPGGSEALSVTEQMTWANKDIDATMPQWYDPKPFHGWFTSGPIKKGFDAKLYGKVNNSCEVIPLLLGGADYFLADKILNKHRIFDLLSLNDRKKNIVLPGFGLYYGAGSFFVDAKNVREISRINTLVAKAEDYYLDGIRQDQCVSFEHVGDLPMVESLNDAGIQVKMPAKITTVARVHQLLQGKRIALITLVTYSNANMGDEGNLKINIAKLANSSDNVSIIDYQTGKIIPVNNAEAVIPVKTIDSGNISLFEVVKNSP